MRSGLTNIAVYYVGWLAGRPLLAAALGAGGGPPAFYAGFRLGAVEFHPTPGLSLAVLALVWALLLPLLMYLSVAAERRDRRVRLSDRSPALSFRSPKGKARWVVLVAVFFVFGAFVTVAMQIDDWGRDFNTNVAETDPAAVDKLLRPLSSDAGLEEVVSTLRDVVTALPRWRLAAEERDASSVTLRCERTTRFLRFTDDVVVRVEDRGESRRVSAVSRSRVGRGDLGQNPRNIKELFGALRENLLFKDS